MQKNIDTILTGFTSCCTIQLFSTTQEVINAYTLFIQGLVAIAAIGKLLLDYTNQNKKNE